MALRSGLGTDGVGLVKGTAATGRGGSWLRNSRSATAAELRVEPVSGVGEQFLLGAISCRSCRCFRLTAFERAQPLT